MEYTLDRFAQQVRDAIAATGQVPAASIELATPKPSIPADLAFPAFRAAKELGMPPPQLAQHLASQIAPAGLIGSVAAAGPFLNFAIDPVALTAAVLDEIDTRGALYGADDHGTGKTIVVDYSAPNIAKRMHVGHIRSTIIGQSIVNIMRANGYTVVGDNHLGDWGKQFGSIIAAVMRYGEPQAQDETALEQFEAIYTRYSAEMKAALEQGDTALDDEARAWSLRLEQGDPAARALWQRTIDLTMGINQKLYDRLGVQIDHAYGESFYEPMLDGVIAEALDTGVAYRDENGAVVVAEIEEKLPTFLLQRSDGGTLYHTRDVATIKFRVSEFNPDRIIYVVGAPQELHFRQLFALMRAMGYAVADRCVHIATGTVFDQHGQALSTRRGNMIYLEALLDEATSRARAVVDQASKDLTEAEKIAIAEQVGIGAVVYNDLYQDVRRNITLDWDRMLSLEGNSAPYIQYMHARCRSILRRAATEGLRADGGDSALLTHPSELALIKTLAKLPAAVREAAERYAPAVIAEWCYDTARAVSAFYRDCPVLKGDNLTLNRARLRLTAAAATALTSGLALLGIRAPAQM